MIFLKQKLFLDVGIDKITNKIKVEETKSKTCKTSHFLVLKQDKRALKKEEGDYYVLQFPSENLALKQKYLTKEVEKVMKNFLKKYTKVEHVLIVGLGNKDVLADALGVYTTNQLIATNHYQDFLTLPKIALFNPSVTNKTGINSFNLIAMVVNNLKPNLIIMIDSLSTANEEYLNTAIEINDTGIIPGSAINSAKEINKKTFNIPVVSIGVPCCLERGKKIYTTVDIEEIIKNSSAIIANALNSIFIKHF